MGRGDSIPDQPHMEDGRSTVRIQREVDWMLMSPLIFAPLIPATKILFPKNKPLFFATVGAAFLHSFIVGTGILKND